MLNKEEIANKYKNGQSCESLCLEYHIGKKKINTILDEFNIQKRKRGGRINNKSYIIKDWSIEKYPNKDGFCYIAKAKDGSYETKDYMNNGGHLTSYIKNVYGIEIPSLYDRREYYKITGNYWWEQWFDIISIELKETKKCPYCDWETIDTQNKTGVFEQHLFRVHNKTIDEYLSEYPKEIDYFQVYKKKQERLLEMSKPRNSINCPICNKSFKRLTEGHLIHSHNISMTEFRKLYPDAPLASETLKSLDIENFKKSNLTVRKSRFVSKYERELQAYLTEWGLEFESNRQILIGEEIDLYIPSLSIGIEFDGLKWHTETFGKKHKNYHLNKTLRSEEKGSKLIHIFEDEYVNKKDVVISKLKHLLGIHQDMPKIMARNKRFTIKSVYKSDAQSFLEKYHIQGFGSATLYLGGYWDDELVAVMAFKNGNIKNACWDLVRFATKDKYIYCGVAGKLFSYFIKNYQPSKIISFADRRWTLSATDNLYTKLGFQLENITKPDYRYYNERIDRYKRFHKMTLNKQALHKKYGLPLSMTEKEMTMELGFDRIWDCGLFKYVWYKK